MIIMFRLMYSVCHEQYKGNVVVEDHSSLKCFVFQVIH